MEIALHQELSEIKIETLEAPSGAVIVRAHMGIENTSDDLIAALVSSGFQDRCDLALNLFSNDNFGRTYETKDDFVVVRKANA